MDKSKIGAALGALRKTSWHFCASCGKRFSGISQAKFCSNACRQKAKYAKVKAQAQASAPKKTADIAST